MLKSIAVYHFNLLDFIWAIGNFRLKGRKFEPQTVDVQEYLYHGTIING